MNKEIKFRAWAKYGEMLPNVQNHIGNDEWAFGNILNSDDFVIMQYTGLKDKNGVEIYEGDIVSEPISPVGGKDGGYLYKSKIIKWEGAGRGYSLFAPHAASIVVGNIYENPELINP